VKPLYFDHAATSFPKAPGVAEEAARFLREDAGNAGRGGHRLAQRAADVLEGARLGLARLLNVGDASRIALQSGTTTALNVALRAVLQPGDRVLVSPAAHNSVLRPLSLMTRERGVSVAEVACEDDLRWDLGDLEAKLAEGATALVVVSHGSNVTGAVQDLGALGALCRAAGARLLVDAAQTVGALPIDLQETPVDLLAFSGHKGLLGPTGTGGLYVAPGVEVAPLVVGGTGSRSEDEAPPRDLPGALEAGTPNAMAFAALLPALAWIEERTPTAIHARCHALAGRLRAGLRELGDVTLHAAEGPNDLSVVSFVVSGWDPQELGMALDAAGGVCVRAGLHCAPRAHRRLATLPHGTLRAGLGPFLEEADVDAFLALLSELVYT
jgi:cysteine desulfurase/selenocysteine lyase